MHTRFGSSLLAVAGCLACAAGDDAPSSGSEGTSSGTTMASTAMPSSGSSDPSMTVTSDATASSDASTTDDTTSTSAATISEPTTNEITSTTAVESESSSTGNGATACMAGCQVEVDCGFCGTKWKNVEACVEWCAANLDEAAAFADDCRDAWAGMHACVGELSCEDFADWCAKDPPFEYACFGADEELSFECKGQ